MSDQTEAMTTTTDGAYQPSVQQKQKLCIVVAAPSLEKALTPCEVDTATKSSCSFMSTDELPSR